MRVHELAKELGMTSKDLIPKIRKLGYDAKNHMSVVEDEIVVLLRRVSGSQPKSNATSKRQAKKDARKEQEDEKAAAEEGTATDISDEEQQELEELQQELEKLDEAEKPQGIQVPMPITVGALSEKISVSVPELIKTLMGVGVFANVNQLLSEDIVLDVADKLEIQIIKEEDEQDKIIKKESETDDPDSLVLRPPVVTMMGHVDHGKTSLLDAIRETNVVAREKGAITQHTSAYGVDLEGKGHVTFMDTPGHEAFTAMRSRGANVTDVVVLVIAADDGVMPQTIEAADHAREAGCPIVVAINKCDLPSADINKVYTGLQKIDLAPEEWGGKTVCVQVSAKTGDGIKELLELLILESEILDLKANPDRHAVGTVIEAHLSKGHGPVSTVIVQKGTLRQGDVVLCGEYYGKVRSLRNDLGKPVKEAGPSYSVQISGLNGVPEAGTTFMVLSDEKQARQIAEKKNLERREREVRGADKHLALEDLYEKISEGSFKELKLIIKADVQGSSEALAVALEKLSTDQCRIRVVHAGIGGINESDVVLAAASDAVVIGFHVKADSKAQAVIEKEKVDVRYYGIIYEAVEDVKKALEGILEPTLQEVNEGYAEVRQVFKSSKAGTIAGSYVTKGKIVRSGKVRLLRDSVVLFEGKMAALKRFKDDVREVKEGYECGISLNGYNDIREQDVIECFRIDKIAGKL